MSEWISVDERLPSHSVDVLVFARCTISIGFLYKHGGWILAKHEHLKNEVTHWMPLPEAPHE